MPKTEWADVLEALYDLGYVGRWGLFEAKHFKKRWDDGAAKHGDLDLSTDPRNWTDEANEELQDYYIYRAFAHIKSGLNRS